MAELEATLSGTLDAVAERRLAAEQCLKHLESQPGALAALLQLATVGGGARNEATRRAAAIRMRSLLPERPAAEMEQLASHMILACASTPHCSSLTDALRLVSQLHAGAAMVLLDALRPSVENANDALPAFIVRALEKILRGAAARDDSLAAFILPVAPWVAQMLLPSAQALTPKAVEGDEASALNLQLHFKLVHRLWEAVKDSSTSDIADVLFEWLGLGASFLTKMCELVSQKLAADHDGDCGEFLDESDLRMRWRVQRRVLKWICHIFLDSGSMQSFACSTKSSSAGGPVPLVLPAVLGVAALPSSQAGTQTISLALEALRCLARDGHISAPEACVEVLRRVVLPQVRGFVSCMPWIPKTHTASFVLQTHAAMQLLLLICLPSRQLELRPPDVRLWTEDPDEYVRRFLDVRELEIDEEDESMSPFGSKQVSVAGYEGHAGSRALLPCRRPFVPTGVPPHKAAAALLSAMLEGSNQFGPPAVGTPAHLTGSPQQENTPPSALGNKKKSGKRGGSKKKKVVLGTAEAALLKELEATIAQVSCALQ